MNFTLTVVRACIATVSALSEVQVWLFLIEIVEAFRKINYQTKEYPVPK